MTTKLFFRADLVSDYGTGTNDANLVGSNVGWFNGQMTAGAGPGASNLVSNSVTGTTAGVEVGGATPYVFYSAPLDAAATISGSITWNIWASESNMSANVAINGQIEVIDGATGTITLIDKTARITEVAVTTNAVNNFAETPAAGVACKKGDRLRIRIFGGDAGTMATGFTFQASVGGPTGAANGDTFIQLTETLTFVSEPAGSQVFPTDTVSDVSTASVDREAWTSRGAGVQNDVTNTTAGWVAPIQVTDTAGGTVVDWFTKPLTAFTLASSVRVNARATASVNTTNVVMRCEIARVAGDGTSPTVWGATTFGADASADLSTVEAAESFLVSGDDLAISNGQRLRIRFSIDDCSDQAMVTGRTVTFFYAGTSGGASGDTFVTLTQSVTEFVSTSNPPYTNVYRALLAQ